MPRSSKSPFQRQWRRLEPLRRQSLQAKADAPVQAAYAKALHRLLVACPRQADALAELGQLAASPEQAQKWYQRSLAVHSRQADVWFQLGLLYEQQGRIGEAVLAFGHCLHLRREKASVSLYLHLAGVLIQAGQRGQALELYLRALQYEPDHPQIFFLLAQLLQWMGDQELALEALMTLGRLYPNQLDLVSFLMGYALEKQGQPEAARQCYDEALRRRPRQLFWQLKRDMVRPLIPDSCEQIIQASQGIEAALAMAVSRLKSQPIHLPREQFFSLSMLHGSIAIGAYYHTRQLPMRQLLAELIQRSAQRPEHWQMPPSHSGRLRLGIVIAPRSLMLGYICAVGMADRLDPAQFEVVLLCQSLEITQLFQPASVFHVSGKHMSWKLISSDSHQATREIRALQLDAVFFTEPGWDFDQYLLAMFRVAPLQFTSWMSPGTTGLPTMDAFLSSSLLEPEQAQASYSEKLELWPTLPSWLPPLVLPEPAPRSDFGLADEWHVYACLQNILKFHPDYDLLLGEILRRDPLGRIVMVSPADQQPLASQLMKRFEARIPDVMDRIWVFPELDNQAFVQLLQCSDVALDPIYFGGGTTSYQSLLCGLPLVTLPADQMVGRISLALASKMGVTDGIVSSPAEYVERAVALAADSAWRADIRQHTLASIHAIIEDEQTIGYLSEFLQDSVQQIRDSGGVTSDFRLTCKTGVNRSWLLPL